MAYRDEDRGFLLARILPSSHPKSLGKESTCMIDKRLNLLVHGARNTLLIVLGTQGQAYGLIGVLII